VNEIIHLFPVALALGVALGAGTRLGHLRRGELPGYLVILMAGRRHRRAAAAILDARAARGDRPDDVAS
jgi:hypothetical protein